LLNGELSHRLKNTLSIVQAIAIQTLGTADHAMLAAFSKRLNALSAAHDVLVKESWSAAPIGDVARAALCSFDESDRFNIAGPDLTIGPRATLALSLLLHELATNATKYGALSVPHGVVSLAWSITGEGKDAAMLLRWVERGGPPAVAPTRRGFGSRIIRMGLTGSGGVDLRYGEEGFTAEMSAPLQQMQQA
jgi:two-component sensor histidine kinase